MSMTSIKKITDLAHFYAALTVRKGDHVVDATAGNGNDTVFLADLVGPSGHVHAFDVQKEALERTAEKIRAVNFVDRVTLIHAGHEKIKKYVTNPLSAVMYNLGFLPRSESKLTTVSSSTLKSFKEALEMLKPGGIVTVVLYPGHPEGKNEIEILVPVCESLDPLKYAVVHTRVLNRSNEPPELLVIQNILFPSVS